MHKQIEHRISPLEAVGLRPFAKGVRDSLYAITGDPDTPGARYDLSSLRLFRPWLGPATWLGWQPRRVPIFNLFNRDLAPRDEGYDVRTTRVRDFRGGTCSYNSHAGTDFVVPIGTTVVAPASGRVVRVENLMYRGGLKVMLDHGEGLITLSGHLARALVEVGDEVGAGAPIGLSGFSAVDGILFYPWVPPHVHFTVLLDGEPVDPFATDGETPLWIGGNDPALVEAEAPPEPWRESAWDADAIDAATRACKDPERRAAIEAIEDLGERGRELVYWRFYHYVGFERHPPLYATSHLRRPRLRIPLRADEFDGLAL